MNRKKWTELLIDYGRSEALSMAEEIREHYPFEVISPPQLALTMIKVRECAKNSLFYLGEVLITSTTIRIKSEIGHGICIGEDPELSEALAFVDAAYKAQLPEFDTWLCVFEMLEERKRLLYEKESLCYGQTVVDFRTMQV